MKVSSNPTRQGIRWQWHALRIVAVMVLLSSIWFPNYRNDLIGVGIALFIGAYVSKSWEEDFLVEVFDDGGSLRFQLGEVRMSANLAEIQAVEFRDGGDGKDIVYVALSLATPFGRGIEFFPEPVRVFDWNTKLWFADLQRRVLEAKTSACKTME